MVTTSTHSRECRTEREPQRTLLLYGLAPARGSGRSGKRSSGTYLESHGDRLLLPIISDGATVTSEELSAHELAIAAHLSDV